MSCCYGLPQCNLEFGFSHLYSWMRRHLRSCLGVSSSLTDRLSVIGGLSTGMPRSGMTCVGCVSRFLGIAPETQHRQQSNCRFCCMQAVHVPWSDPWWGNRPDRPIRCFPGVRVAWPLEWKFLVKPGWSTKLEFISEGKVSINCHKCPCHLNCRYRLQDGDWMVFIRRTGRPCTSSCSPSGGLPIACLHPDLSGLGLIT